MTLPSVPTEFFTPEAKSALSHNGASCTDANPLFSPTLEPTPTSVPVPIPTVLPGNPSRSPTFYPTTNPTATPSAFPTAKPEKVKKTSEPTSYDEAEGTEVSRNPTGSNFKTESASYQSLGFWIIQDQKAQIQNEIQDIHGTI